MSNDVARDPLVKKFLADSQDSVRQPRAPFTEMENSKFSELWSKGSHIFVGRMTLSEHGGRSA